MTLREELICFRVWWQNRFKWVKHIYASEFEIFCALLLFGPPNFSFQAPPLLLSILSVAGFPKVHKSMKIWKIFKLLKIWKTYNSWWSDYVICLFSLWNLDTLAPLILLVDKPYAHFGCVAHPETCISPFVALFHFVGCVTHFKTYMWCTFCGTTSLYVYYGCYVYPMTF